EDRDEDDDDGDTFDMWDITVEDVEWIRKFFNVPDEINEIVQPLIPEPIHTTPPNDNYVAPATKFILDEILEEFRGAILNVTMVNDEVHSVIINTKPFIHTQLMSPLYGVFKASKPCKVDRDIISSGRLVGFACFLLGFAGSNNKEMKFKVTLTHNYVCILVNELCGYVRWKPSRDFTRLLGPPSGLKGLFHTLNATVIPTKLYRWLVKSPMMLNVARGSKLRAWL
ncbi:hypothetical protein Tco_1441927, partial [Tanacetum coccineum]